MAKYVFPAVIRQEDGAWTADFPDLPGCSTFGGSFDDALAMAEDALGLMLCFLEDASGPVPVPGTVKRAAAAVAADTDAYRAKMGRGAAESL